MISLTESRQELCSGWKIVACERKSSGLSQYLSVVMVNTFFPLYNSWLTCLSPPQRIFLEKTELILLLLWLSYISCRYLVIVYWMNEWAPMSTELWWQTYFYLKLQNHDWSLSQKQTRHPFLLQSACSILRLCAKFPFPVWEHLQLSAQSTDDIKSWVYWMSNQLRLPALPPSPWLL